VGDLLLERDFETRAMRRSMADLALGCGSVLALAAPVGLGKTALLRSAREHAREQGFRVLSARGAQLEAAFAYGVVRQLVEPARQFYGKQCEWLFQGSAGPGRGSRGPAGGSAPAALNGLYRLLTDLAEKTPVVVIVDDMQWVDPPSARFLGFLARRVESTPVALIVGARSNRNQHDESLDEILTTAEIMLLQPRSLSRAAVDELIRREYGRPGEPEFCHACHEATAGNPLFLRELLRTLTTEGVSPEAGSAAAVRAAGPVAVRRHLLVALRGQSATARAVARAVAVLGDDTDLDRVAWQCGLTVAAATAAAHQLTRDGLFARADPPAFAHPVVRDAMQGLTAPSERTVRRRPEQPAGEKHDAVDRPRPTGLETFTTAERAVAGLAVSGLMNRQIAERLFLSEKTIESHLSRVYRKTGVRSRTELAAHLSATGRPDRPEGFHSPSWQSPPSAVFPTRHG
jgi:DNA-binding CsgD family transcriptional regulator